MRSCNLPSNSGWNMTSWRLRDVVKVGRKQYLLVEVILTGRYWERVEYTRRNVVSAGLVKDYSVVLPQVLLAEAELKKLYRELANWLKTPISKLIETPLTVGRELAGLDSQTFSIEFGLREDLIIDVGHTACTVSYQVKALSGKCAYVVDQSCVRTFVEGLGDFLSSDTGR